jgi:integrase
LRYVSPVTGKRRNAGLGVYPNVGVAVAGKLARELREAIAAGSDPLEAKTVERAKPAIPSFREAAEQVHEELVPGWKNPKHARQWINSLATYAFPGIGSLPVNLIEPRHVADVLRPIWLSKQETASRVRQRLHAVMAWAWAHGFVPSNPVDVVAHLLPVQADKSIREEHFPAMPWREVPKFAKDELVTADGHDVTRRALLFLILTGCRSGEVRGMQWSEVNLKAKVWTIPAQRMKAGVVHRIPLSDQALALLKGRHKLDDELVFPSIRARKILSDMTLTALLRRVKAHSDTPGRFATAHGFRSSFRDWCSENGYTRDLAERALAHTIKDQTEAAYHRTDLLEQRRPMMQAWADFVMPSVHQQPNG